ncbi:MAG: hypothetical protein E6K54_02045 [Gammaproteobacteria bacterium]|nr:MAG: hypothetical protein E6K54_02045 [Gammaproteobacteria bacterium]
MQEVTEIQSEIEESFPVMSAMVPLINPVFYRPYLLKKFKDLKGELKEESINSLDTLMQLYPIVINCSGWEAKYLADDGLVYPIRGQTEIVTKQPCLENNCSINVEHKNMYVVFRPGEQGKGDCVMGTTYQVNNFSREPSIEDKQIIPVF